MTNNELALILLREMDEASDQSELVTVVEGWIDDSLDEFASAHNWKLFNPTQQFSTVASQSTYSLPSDVIDIESIRFVTTDEPIDYVSEQELAGIAEDLESLGKPRFWFFTSPLDVAGTQNQTIYQIRFAPIPDAIYALERKVQVHPTVNPLTSLAEIPLRKEMILALKDRVRAYLYFNDDRVDLGSTYLQLFYGRVERMINKDNTEPSAKIQRMQVRDISNTTNRRYARLDPSHFHN